MKSLVLEETSTKFAGFTVDRHEIQPLQPVNSSLVCAMLHVTKRWFFLSVDQSWFTKPKGTRNRTSAGGIVVRSENGCWFVALVRGEGDGEGAGAGAGFGVGRGNGWGDGRGGLGSGEGWELAAVW